MNEVYLLTGGNMGQRQSNLARAMEMIGKRCGQVKRYSALYETEAWGKPDQPAFLNQALELRTSLQPLSLLTELLFIEKKIGRIRKEKYGPRVIDVDILLYGARVIRVSRLKIPHPEMQNRRFALVPLAEIASKVLHPVLNKPIIQLLDECEDPLLVKKI